MSDDNDEICIRLTPKLRAYLNAVVLGREDGRRMREAIHVATQQGRPVFAHPPMPGGPMPVAMRMPHPGPPLGEIEVARLAFEHGIVHLLQSLTSEREAQIGRSGAALLDEADPSGVIQ